MKGEKHLENLNIPQKEAVLHMDGPILVLAGAGAGKTRVIVSRISNLIANGVHPSNILAITFTNKAAGEMRDRVLSVVKQNSPYDTSTPVVSTFHSLGVRILREDGEILGIKRNFIIFDRQDAIRSVKSAMKKVGVSEKQWNPKKIQEIISREKGKAVAPEDYGTDSHFSFVEKVVAPVWREYEKILKEEKALDFDDLLLKPLQIFEKSVDVRKKYQERWKYVHIDEYQDTNAVQYKMAMHLIGDRKNIFVVGDSDQTIYTWRGANIHNILNFEEDFPTAKTVLLEENYRSTKNIIRAAQDIIEKNTLRKEKHLFTNNDEGERVGMIFGLDENDESERVANKISELISLKVPTKEIAILYRTNFQSRALEDAMLRHDIPYHLVGTRFFQRKEIKDMISYIRLALNPDSISDLKRVINTPKRGIGKVTLLKLVSGQSDQLSPKIQKKISDFWEVVSKIKEKIETDTPSNVVRFVYTHSGMQNFLETSSEDDTERAENVKELVTFATKYDEMPSGEGIEKLLEDAALASDQDSLQDSKDGVRLMTVHASKGLEFDYVFITGLEEGLFPQSREDASLEEEEEERRLFYVALTRARKKVFLLHTSGRTIFGQKIYNIPSEFLSDISEELVEDEDEHIATVFLD